MFVPEIVHLNASLPPSFAKGAARVASFLSSRSCGKIQAMLDGKDV
jgi:hypothetical protein